MYIEHILTFVMIYSIGILLMLFLHVTQILDGGDTHTFFFWNGEINCEVLHVNPKAVDQIRYALFCKGLGCFILCFSNGFV